MSDDGFRSEHDSMGELKVPKEALWGAQTQRAVQNFPISGLTLPRAFIRALGLIKASAARVNRELSLLDAARAEAIEAAALRWPRAATIAISPLMCFKPAPAPVPT